ncbi:MAG: hypothetical protein ACLQVI_43230 [Polyangiaceae bacterium]
MRVVSKLTEAERAKLVQAFAGGDLGLEMSVGLYTRDALVSELRVEIEELRERNLALQHEVAALMAKLASYQEVLSDGSGSAGRDARASVQGG